ncbi:hypothetical protein ZB65_004733 [Salmonella enterica subsp. enterica]|uniref:Uncharacterized protein n=1 Tax=Salmonella enterica TaxID=28901 RepID=A0A744ENE8_SALER|nr:hypothetical protein [Salmonella enterica subsp. enterica serovar Richmond]EDW1079267.1 hypothetical protein [Salmonella enterica subsp. enterica serovar Richmond]HAF2502815.1 hypothetical protein [Salmonella enterica]
MKHKYQNSSSGIITTIGLQNPIINALNALGFTSATGQKWTHNGLRDYQ